MKTLRVNEVCHFNLVSDADKLVPVLRSIDHGPIPLFRCQPVLKLVNVFSPVRNGFCAALCHLLNHINLLLMLHHIVVSTTVSNILSDLVVNSRNF